MSSSLSSSSDPLNHTSSGGSSKQLTSTTKPTNTNTGEHHHAQPTTAITRSYRHLNVSTWLTTVATAAATRTIIQHPLVIAAARKRVHRYQDNDTVRKPPSIAQILRETREQGQSEARQKIRNSRGGGGLASSSQRMENFRVKAAGARAMYRGVGVCIIGNMLGETTYLGTVEFLREKFPSKFPYVRDAAGGASGDFISLFMTSPLSLICNRQMTAGYGIAAENRYGGFRATVNDLLWPSDTTQQSQNNTTAPHRRRPQWRALFAGLVPGFYVLPASACWWSCYGRAKEALYFMINSDAFRFLTTKAKKDDKKSSTSTKIARDLFFSKRDNPFLNGIAGLTASILVACTFTPFAVMRTRIQVLATSEKAKRRYSVVARDLWAKEGLKGFFRGVTTNGLMAALDGILFANVYEISRYLNDVTRSQSKAK